MCVSLNPANGSRYPDVKLRLVDSVHLTPAPEWPANRTCAKSIGRAKHGAVCKDRKNGDGHEILHTDVERREIVSLFPNGSVAELEMLPAIRL